MTIQKKLPKTVSTQDKHFILRINQLLSTAKLNYDEAESYARSIQNKTLKKDTLDRIARFELRAKDVK